MNTATDFSQHRQESLLACLGTWGDENPQTAADLRVQIGQYIQKQSLVRDQFLPSYVTTQ